jgi:hypothetical protein
MKLDIYKIIQEKQSNREFSKSEIEDESNGFKEANLKNFRVYKMPLSRNDHSGAVTNNKKEIDSRIKGIKTML